MEERMKTTSLHKKYFSNQKQGNLSNLVGDNTQAKKSFGRGASKRACNMGRAKAAVLPEPV